MLRLKPQGTTVLLMVAVGLGAVLRFVHLGAREMSADEGASWAAASASSLGRVLELQPKLNPGKFAIHELLLHGWMQIFGDGLVSIRALSALAGTLVVAVAFLVVRELFDLSRLTLTTDAEDKSPDRSSIAPAAAFAALLIAVNLVFIKYAREGRMYSIGLLAAVIQVWVFLRSLHHSSLLWWFATALFTAVAIASTFTMFLLLASEALWLVYLLRHRSATLNHRIALTSLAIFGALPLLAIPALIYWHVRENAPSLLAYAWAPVPPFWAPISLFNKATGDLGFPIALVLALTGWARTWSRDQDVAMFLILWTLFPPVLALTASYLIRPAFVERYVVVSFVPFFILVALGLQSFKGAVAKRALSALVVLTALAHLYAYWQHPHDVEWREAVQIATASPADTVVVAPPYAIDVVRYYLQKLNRRRNVSPSVGSSGTVAIVADTGISSVEREQIAAAFPYLVKRLRGVTVRQQRLGAS